MVVVAVTVHILLSFPSASNALREVLLALRLSHCFHLPVSFGFLVSIPGILRQCLYIPPGYPPPASKFCMLPPFFFFHVSTVKSSLLLPVSFLLQNMMFAAALAVPDLCVAQLVILFHE